MDGECRPVTRFTFDLDPAAMRADDSLSHGQPESDTGDTLFGRPNPAEGLENVANLFRRNAHALIRNFKTALIGADC